MEWRWADPYGQQRIIRTDELRAGLSTGVIPPNAPVWKKGWTEWKPAYEVGELSSPALSAAHGIVPAIPPPPLFVLEAHAALESRSDDKEEPPPPPRYVPAGSKSAPETIPVNAVQVAVAHRASQAPPPPPSTGGSLPKAPPSEPSGTPTPLQAETAPSKSAPGVGAESNKAHPPDLSSGQVVTVPRLDVEDTGKHTAISDRSPAPDAANTEVDRRTMSIAEAEKVLSGYGPSEPPGPREKKRRSTLLMFNKAEEGAVTEDPPGEASPSQPIVVPSISREKLGKHGVTRSPTNEGKVSVTVRGTPKPPESTEELIGDDDLVETTSPANVIAEASSRRSSGPPPLRKSLPPPVPKKSSFPPAMPPALPKPALPKPVSLTPSSPPPPIPAAAPDFRRVAPISITPPPAKVSPAPPPTRVSSGPPPLKVSSVPPPLKADPTGGASLGKPEPSGAVALGKADPTGEVSLGKPEPSAAAALGEGEPSGAIATDAKAEGGEGQRDSARPTARRLQSAPDASEVKPSQDASPPANDEATIEVQKLEEISNEPSPSEQKPEVNAPRKTLSSISRVDLPIPPSPLHQFVRSVEEAAAGFPFMKVFKAERPALFRPVLWGGLGALGLIAFVSVVSRCGNNAEEERVSGSSSAPRGSSSGANNTSASALASVAPQVSAVLPSSSTGPSPSTATRPLACILQGVPKRTGEKALVGVGLDVAVNESVAAIGLARTERDAAVIRLDRTTLESFASPIRFRSPKPIRRVSPWLRGSDALLVVDGEGGDISARRYANGWDFGSKEGSLVAAKHGAPTTTPLWPLEGEAAVEALRVIATESGWSLVFRRAGKIVHGELRLENGKPVPDGPLVAHESTAEKVGPPTIAKNHGYTLIAWAEKQDANWGLKVFSSSAGVIKTFSTRGNPQAADQLSPSLAAVGDQAFFFTWTEGAADKNEVWGVLVDSNVNVSGSLTRLSWEGGNAGKAQVAVGKDGRGIVGFLEGSGKQMDVIASSIVCRSDAP